MFGREFLILAAICVLPLSAKQSSNIPEKQTDPKKEDELKKVKDKRCILFKAFENALSTNKDILAMEYEIKAANESHTQVRAAFLPTIDANAGFGASDTDSWVSNMGQKNTSKNRGKTCGLTAKYNIFHGLADVAALKEINLQLRARWSRYEATKQKVLREVAAYYFEIYAKMQELRHLNALLESRKGSLEVVSEMFKAGSAKYLDVAQATAGCAEVEAMIAKAQANYESLRAKFTELTGYVLPNTFDVPEKLIDPKMPVKQGIDLAMRNNPNIIAAADNLAAAREAARKPIGKLLPTLDISCGLHNSLTQNPGADNSNNREQTFQVALKWQLYDGGVGRSEKRQAQELACKAAIEKEKAIEETRTEIVSTWATLDAARRNLESANQAVKARWLALEDITKEHLSGTKIMNDVLKAQHEYFEAQTLVIQAQKEYLTAQSTAAALVGRMNQRYLKLAVPSSEFNYEQHLSRVRGRV
ncbi:MAG: TolC family protein [Holosporales bacterium]|jgi:outer membrane protein|nr:TolC family protein [Holosporales bacterium]